MRVARMAASTTACLARLKPKKSRSRPVWTTSASMRTRSLAVVDGAHAELVEAAGIGEDQPRTTHRRHQRRRRFNDAHSGAGQQQNVVGDVQNALAVGLEVAIGLRSAERPQDESARMSASTRGPIGAMLTAPDRGHRGDDAFEDHGRFPLGSRFSLISSSVTVEATPSFGTSAWQIHTAALRTTLRKLSSSQFRWKWPPVKPTPRPPSGRSTAHIIVSARPFASWMCGVRPLGIDVGPVAQAASLGLADRIGVTPFMSGRKRMLKYHSSRIENGLTPRVIACSGKSVNSGVHIGLQDHWMFVIAADPVLEFLAALVLRHLDGVSGRTSGRRRGCMKSPMTVRWSPWMNGWPLPPSA